MMTRPDDRIWSGKIKTPTLLETTLRDGSYAINFQFTAQDTSMIVKGLESCGVQLIEIGHGVGIGASEAGLGKAASTDEEYMKAAANTLTHAHFGMFCIPGIARLEHLDIAKDYGMGFIRIGTDVNDLESSRPFIEKSKKNGLLVAANFMKSYAMSPKEFAQKAVLTQRYGSDVLFIVDSAGGMLPGEVDQYFQAVRDVCDIPLAFHGHQNLGLAVSHCIKAMEWGAVIVDGSMRGLGRSAGNASSEMLVCVAKRMGFDFGIDLYQLMDLSDRMILPLMHQMNPSSLDTVMGYAQFHSSYSDLVCKVANKHQVDARRLIVALGQIAKGGVSESAVERIALEIKEKSEDVYASRFNVTQYFGEEGLLDSR